jgi:anti-anti-sigma factor
MVTLSFPRSNTAMMLTILERHEGDVAVLSLEGRLLFGPEADSLRKHIRSLVKAGKNRILLGLAKLIRIDSVGVGTLIEAATLARRHGGDVRLFAVSPPAAAVLSLLRLDNHPDWLRSFPDESQACLSFLEAPTHGLGTLRL